MAISPVFFMHAASYFLTYFTTLIAHKKEKRRKCKRASSVPQSSGGFTGCADLRVNQENSLHFLLLAASVCLSCVRGTSSCRPETPVGRAEAESPSTGQ